MGKQLSGGEQKPHALIVPFPLQGHINPMMHLAQKLLSDGFMVTFVNSEHNHSCIKEAKEKMKLEDALNKEDNMRMVCISDALPLEVSRSDISKLLDSLRDTLASSLLKLIQDINQNESHKITCAVFDLTIYYVRHVALHFDIPYALFCTLSVASAGICHLGSSLLSSGIVSANGRAKVQKMINVLPCMPPLHSTHLVWMFGSEDAVHKHFQTTLDIEKEIQDELILFNSFFDLEAPVIGEYPGKGINVCSIGPLIDLEISDQSTRLGTLRAEEVECLGWLDKQSPASVIYVSFGSLAILNVKQFQELGLGLEATGRRFLWVVRSDLLDGTTAVFPAGFLDRVRDRGCIVSWAPQLSVLCHPSTACYITHCGWNSTVESISTGVPMLCWPHFIDQFLNCSYIVNEWKVGLQLIANREGLVEKGEIETAVEKLLVGEEAVEMKKRATQLKERARLSVKEGGSSSINYNLFLENMPGKQI